MCKVAVIGTVIADEIESAENRRFTSLGGIYYTILYLAALLESSDLIFPVSYVGYDLEERFLNMLSKLPNVCQDGIMSCDQKNNVVLLSYNSNGDRTENSQFPLPPLTFEQIKDFTDVDMLLINMVSGWDINLNTLLKIRESFSGPVYLDIHSLALGRRNNGMRYYRRPVHFAQWLESCDIVQMNENEFNILNSDNLRLEEFYRKYCISKGNLINLTFGKNGSKSVYLKKDRIILIEADAHLSTDSVDPTGCGDAFMAGYCTGFLNALDINTCLNMANTIAGINARFEGIPDYNQLVTMINEEWQL